VQLLIDCAGGPGNRLVGLKGAGTGASAEYSAIKTMDDAPATTLAEARGVSLDDPTFGFVPIVEAGRNAFPGGSSFSHFYRANGSIVLRTPTTVTTVAFDLLVDDRNFDDPGVCRMLGTATPSS
jgi:hypothetical protein